MAKRPPRSVVHIADHAVTAAQSRALIVADGPTISYGELKVQGTNLYCSRVGRTDDWFRVGEALCSVSQCFVKVQNVLLM